MNGQPLGETGTGWFDERALDRTPIHISTTMHDRKAGVQVVLVTNLSRAGCRVVINRKMTVGSIAVLALTEAIDVTGWVAWSQNGEIGIDFANPLTDALLTAILDRDTKNQELVVPSNNTNPLKKSDI